MFELPMFEPYLFKDGQPIFEGYCWQIGMIIRSPYKLGPILYNSLGLKIFIGLAPGPYYIETTKKLQIIFFSNFYLMKLNNFFIMSTTFVFGFFIWIY